jgi:hypothetical protein
MKKLLATCLFLTIALAGIAQQEIKPSLHLPFQYRHSAQVEIFGNGLFYSVNYEGVFANGPALKGTIRAGAALYPPATGLIAIWLPITVNGLASFGAHHIEFGVGVIPTRDSWSRRPEYYYASSLWSMFGTARLGYHYQRPDGHLILKATFTPIIESYSPLGGVGFSLRHTAIHPLGGLSVGYAF